MDELTRAAGTPHDGGLCTVATPREVPQHRLLLALDGVGNPHNLGAAPRSSVSVPC